MLIHITLQIMCLLKMFKIRKKITVNRSSYHDCTVVTTYSCHMNVHCKYKMKIKSLVCLGKL